MNTLRSMQLVFSTSLPAKMAWLTDIITGFGGEQRFAGLAALSIVLCALAILFILKLARHQASSRTPVLASIGTAVPSLQAGQDFFIRACSTLGYDKAALELVEKVAKRGGINTRHSCNVVEPEVFVDSLDASPLRRAQLWEENAPKLAIAAATQALQQWPHGDARDVTHVVVHSCTGFSAPGLDFLLIQALGLPSSTRKLGVNYMGCFGFFTASYVAKQIIEADTTGKAVVLVCCAETCSLHFSRDCTPELIVGNALFADGSAAAIVTHAGFRGKGARTLGPAPDGVTIDPATRTPAFRLSGLVDPVDGQAYEWGMGHMSSEIVPSTAGHMTWKQGANPGRYDMYLDKGIPQALAGTLATGALGLLSRVGIRNPWRRTAWAIHPGGKAILSGFHKALTALAIPARGISCSTDVLANYGNMSSPTIAFVLQRVLTGQAGHGEADHVFIAGFGPGLTVEFGRIFKVKGQLEGQGEAGDKEPEVSVQAAQAAAAAASGTSMETATRPALDTTGRTTSASPQADSASDGTSDPGVTPPSRLSPTNVAEHAAEPQPQAVPASNGKQRASTRRRAA